MRLIHVDPARGQVLGLVILRIKEPMLERYDLHGFESYHEFSRICRPYKTWIITPLTFCAVCISHKRGRVVLTQAQVCLFLLCMPVIAAPLEALAALGTITEIVIHALN